MSPLSIVLFAYVSLGMLKLAFVLYGSAGKDVQRWNARMFEQVRAAGPAAIVIGMAAEILLWPYGLWLGYRVVRKLAQERREASFRAERCARGELVRIGRGPFDDTLQPTYHRPPEGLSSHLEIYHPEGSAELSEELKAKIARDLRRERDPETGEPR